MKLNFNFNGKTRLKHWWTIVRDNFQTVMNSFNSHIIDFEAEKTRLNTEITNRTEADEALSGRIDTEKSSRESGYSTLSREIALESNDRKAGDAKLQNQIDNLKQQDNALDLYGEEVTNVFKVVFPSGIPIPFFNGGQEYYGEQMTIKMPENVKVYINDKQLTFTWDCSSQILYTNKDNYIEFIYDTETGDGNIYVRENPVESKYDGQIFVFGLYLYSNFNFDFKISSDSPTGDLYVFQSCTSKYTSVNADATGATYTVTQEFMERRTREDLATENKDSFLDAVNENASKAMANAESIETLRSELPNLKKNPANEAGDITDTHMTVGTRAAESQYGIHSFTSGEENIASGSNSDVIGGQANEVASTGSNSVIIGGHSNRITNINSAIVGGVNAIAYRCNTVFGHRNAAPRAGGTAGIIGDAIIVGNGTPESQSNAFRVAYDGNVYCGGEYSSTGADYAECLEWEDGNPNNEGRRGLFAYIVGRKIRLATSEDTDKKRLSINLSQIVRLVNKQPLALFVSIHFNSGGGRGTEVFTYDGAKHTEVVSVCNALHELGFVNRGVKDGSNLYVVRKSNAKAMLIEVCFVDTDDVELYKKIGADGIAQAIYAAITGQKIEEDIDMEELKRLQNEVAELKKQTATYDYMDDNMPSWAKPTIQKLMDKGILVGDEHGKLGLTMDMIKVFVIHDRAGLYD